MGVASSEGATCLAGLGNYRALLMARGRTPHHIGTTCRHVRELLLSMEVVTEQEIVIAIGRIMARGRSLRTCNSYLRSMKSYVRWCVKTGLLAKDVSADIPLYRQDRDRRHRRAAFTEEELGRLLRTTAKSQRLWRGISGIDRAALYHAAVCTGLRESTLALLEVGQFHVGLSDSIAFVHVLADQVKDAEDLVVPIEPHAAGRLREYLANRPADSRAFAMPPHRWDVVRMLRADLIEAGINYCQRSMLTCGAERRTRVLDFHAFRTTFGTRCARAGVPLSTLQRWMGHSTPVLTANVYNSVQLADAAGPLHLMPQIPWGI